jgi:hypothetical protein
MPKPLLFVGAVFRRWMLLVTGGVVSLGGIFWAQLGPVSKSNSIPRWVFWSVAAICLFLAFYLAWRDEHVARLKAESQPPSLAFEAVEKLAEARAKIAALEERLGSRTFTSEQRARIISGLSIEARCRVVVGYPVNDVEAHRFADIILRLFQSTGWDTPKNLHESRELVEPGIAVLQRSTGEVEECASRVSAIFASVGLKSEIRSNHTPEPGSLIILVGPKPQ